MDAAFAAHLQRLAACLTTVMIMRSTTFLIVSMDGAG
jgi:hypothetical protein